MFKLSPHMWPETPVVLEYGSLQSRSGDRLETSRKAGEDAVYLEPYQGYFLNHARRCVLRDAPEFVFALGLDLHTWIWSSSEKGQREKRWECVQLLLTYVHLDGCRGQRTWLLVCRFWKVTKLGGVDPQCPAVWKEPFTSFWLTVWTATLTENTLYCI